jgi:hypothetical protein
MTPSVERLDDLICNVGVGTSVSFPESSVQSRWIILVALFVVGCQRGQPQVGAPEQQIVVPPKSDPALVTASVSGLIMGKPFLPDRITYDKSGMDRLIFRRGSDFFPEMQISIRQWKGDDEPREGAELNFGGRFEDPWIIVSIKGANNLPQPEVVQPKDYAMTLKFTKRRKGWFDGTIDLRIANPEKTHLVGTFSAQISTAVTVRPTADDAPFVSGQIRKLGDWNYESVVVGIVGKEPDGKGYSTHIGLSKVHAGLTDQLSSSALDRPQRSCIISDLKGGLWYKYVKMPVGEFIVYLSRDGVVADWQKVSIKDDHQQIVDLTIDPSKWGKLVVTLSDAEANDKIDYPETLLALVPFDLDPSDKEIRRTFTAAEMDIGKKSVALDHVPSGKYVALRGSSQSVVDVVPGKSAAVLLVRDPSK